MGTILISNGNSLKGKIFPSTIHKRGRTFKLKAVSDNPKSAIKEVLVQKLRGNEATTKTKLVTLIYVAPLKKRR